MAKTPEVSFESLLRIFTVPEGETSTLSRIEKEISENLSGFLRNNIVSSTTPPANLEKTFSAYSVPEEPVYVSEQADFLLKHLVSQAVHTASPRFVGHMTSALPYFMLPLSKMMIALNQNLVKIETSKSFTPLERQVIGMIHHLIYDRPRRYYKKYIQNPECALGAFCSNGTIANITALWVALNKALPRAPGFDGVAEEGLYSGLSHYNHNGACILVSERGHYSLSKAANLLGIGKKNLISIPTDNNNKIKLSNLRTKVEQLRSQNKLIIAVVGIAGTTETGSIDPLEELSAFCQEHQIHFHVDAAWGGPTLFSSNYKHLLQGIELADSVTFDAHKQLYVPMGAALAVFKNQKDLSLVEHNAEYIIRKGSRDLGRKTLEGSRPGMAMLVHSGLKILGRRGYELLIDTGIEKAQLFANMLKESQCFELISEPELNILTYRFVPEDVRPHLESTDPRELEKINNHLNRLTVTIQKEQRDGGMSFVSRTVLKPAQYNHQEISVFRVVLANPLTQESHLRDLLKEQEHIANRLMKGEFQNKAVSNASD